MAQQLVVGTAYTAALIFTDANGVTGVGPMGVPSASDPSITVGLSADGQFMNVLMSTTLADVETVRWHDPSDVIPDATADITDQVVTPPFVAATASIATFVEGTTA